MIIKVESSFCAKSTFEAYEEFKWKFMKEFIFGQGRIRPLSWFPYVFWIYIIFSIYTKFSVEGECTFNQLSIWTEKHIASWRPQPLTKFCNIVLYLKSATAYSFFPLIYKVCYEFQLKAAWNFTCEAAFLYSMNKVL